MANPLLQAITSGALNFAGGQLAANEADRTNKQNVAFAREGRDFARTHSVSNPFGDRTSIHGTELSPGSQQLMETIRANAQKQGDIAGQSFDQFSSGIDPLTGKHTGEFSGFAGDIVERDIGRKQNLASDLANTGIESAIRRTGTGSSNFNANTIDAAARATDQFNLGKETSQYELGTKMYDDFIKRALLTGQTANQPANAFAAQFLPQTPSFGQAVAAFNSSAIPQSQPDPGAGLPFAVAGQTLQDIISRQQVEQAQKDQREFILNLAKRLEGNQGSNVSYSPTPRVDPLAEQVGG